MSIIKKHIPGNDIDTIKSLLLETSEELFKYIEKKEGLFYQVSMSEPDSSDDTWSCDIKIRSGNKIGTSVELKWEELKGLPNELEIHVEESTKLGTIILIVIFFSFSLIGCYMGSNHIPPLDFLPDWSGRIGGKIAAALGALIALVPGGILGYIIRSVVMRKEKNENQELLSKIEKRVQEYLNSNN